MVAWLTHSPLVNPSARDDRKREWTHTAQKWIKFEQLPHVLHAQCDRVFVVFHRIKGQIGEVVLGLEELRSVSFSG